MRIISKRLYQQWKLEAFYTKIIPIFLFQNGWRVLSILFTRGISKYSTFFQSISHHKHLWCHRSEKILQRPRIFFKIKKPKQDKFSQNISLVSGLQHVVFIDEIPTVPKQSYTKFYHLRHLLRSVRTAALRATFPSWDGHCVSDFMKNQQRTGHWNCS